MMTGMNTDRSVGNSSCCCLSQNCKNSSPLNWFATVTRQRYDLYVGWDMVPPIIL